MRRQTKLLQIPGVTSPSLPALTGKQRIAHKPNSKPKLDAVLDLKEEDEEKEGSRKCTTTEEELWARLDELEKQEELQDDHDR